MFAHAGTFLFAFVAAGLGGAALLETGLDELAGGHIRRGETHLHVFHGDWGGALARAPLRSGQLASRSWNAGEWAEILYQSQSQEGDEDGLRLATSFPQRTPSSGYS